MGLLISWIILVTPHVVFQDLVLRGQWYSFGTLMESQYFNIFHKNNWELIEVCYDVSAEIFQKIFSSSTQKCLEILRAMEDESENILYLLLFQQVRAGLNRYYHPIINDVMSSTTISGKFWQMLSRDSRKMSYRVSLSNIDALHAYLNRYGPL